MYILNIGVTAITTEADLTLSKQILMTESNNSPWSMAINPVILIKVFLQRIILPTEVTEVSVKVEVHQTLAILTLRKEKTR